MYRRKKEAHDWGEWQADTIASGLLMPRQLILESLPRFGLGERIDMLNRLYRPIEYKRFCELADYLGVSKQALSIRLKQLNLLGKDYLANPNELPRVYCDESDSQFY
jgi:Zn-dependent peptidase ImmA (M78 family)